MKKLRADAERNRERILAVARDAFGKAGVNVSLDEIAKQAAVGPGTLYRHFPTREVLLQEVYRVEVERLGAAEAVYAKELAPVEALRAWMLLFVDYVAAKQIIAPALNAVVENDPCFYEASKTTIVEAIEALVKRAIESGDIRADLVPLDLLRALVGVSNVASSPGWVESAKRLVDILILGSRPG